MSKTIIFYDTETNGLPNWSVPSEDPSQPHVTQLAAELCVEETGEVLLSMDMLIRPDGWEIPLDLQEMTGITMERALRDGHAADEVMHEFLGMWIGADQRCGHNESFDMRMLRIEIMRHSHFSMQTVGGVPFADYWKKQPAYCTQSKSTKIVNDARPKGEKKKTASLAEAYKHFTGEELVGAHDAKVDIMAAKAIYYGIKKHLAAA